MIYEKDECCVFSGVSKGVGARAAAMGVVTKAPVPKKISHVLEAHGDKREDNYYWIRDDERNNPEVLAYLEEENKYTESVMVGETLANFQLHCLKYDMNMLAHRITF